MSSISIVEGKNECGEFLLANFVGEFSEFLALEENFPLHSQSYNDVHCSDGL